jgi:hypothetical protein
VTATYRTALAPPPGSSDGFDRDEAWSSGNDRMSNNGQIGTLLQSSSLTVETSVGSNGNRQLPTLRPPPIAGVQGVGTNKTGR